MPELFHDRVDKFGKMCVVPDLILKRLDLCVLQGVLIRTEIEEKVYAPRPSSPFRVRDIRTALSRVFFKDPDNRIADEALIFVAVSSLSGHRTGWSPKSSSVS